MKRSPFRSTPDLRRMIQASWRGVVRVPAGATVRVLRPPLFVSPLAATGERTIYLRLPIALRPEKNLREHVQAKARRTAGQRAAIRLHARIFKGVVAPVAVQIVRIAPRALDTGDNLALSASAIRDEIAALVGIDDGDPRIVFAYDQRSDAPRTFGVEITVRWGGA